MISKTSQLLTLGGALLLAPLTPTFGQSDCTTVDEVKGGATYAGGNAVTEDKFVTVFTAGNYQRVNGNTTNTHRSTRLSVRKLAAS